MERKHYPILITGLLSLPFLLGFLWPETMWGSNFLFFSPTGIQIIIILSIILLLGISYFGGNNELLSRLFSKSLPSASVWVIAFFIGLLCYNFPIPNDFYGNSRGFHSTLDHTITVLPDNFWKDLFSFEFTPGNGRKGVHLIVQFIAYTAGTALLGGFKLLGAFCGAIFAGIWLNSVRKFIAVGPLRTLLVFAGLSSPLFLVFFGHIETYAPVFLLLFSVLLSMVNYIKAPSIKKIIPIIILMILGIRLHSLMYLVVPGFLLALFNIHGFNPKVKQRIHSLKGTLIYVYIPLLLAGMVVYFFVFEDHLDPRKLSGFKDIDRLFLPIFSPEPPLDKYNLFSLNHILDYFNNVLLWSPGLLFLSGLLLFHKKKINWNAQAVVFPLLTFLLFATLLFVINPLFSMPMDWDLFLFPVPVLMVVLLVTLGSLKEENSPSIGFAGIGACLFSIAAFIVILSPSAASNRITSIGKHVYKTYYEHSSTYLLHSLQSSSNEEVYIKREDKIINDLRPYALIGNDKQFSDLLNDRGIMELTFSKNTLNARSFFLESMDYFPLAPPIWTFLIQANDQLIAEGYTFLESDSFSAQPFLLAAKKTAYDRKQHDSALYQLDYASLYYPTSRKILLHRVQINYLKTDYASAYTHALNLLEMAFPSHEQALRIAIQMSLEAENIDACLAHCTAYTSSFGTGGFIQRLKTGLENQENIESLKGLFKQAK